MAYFKHIVETNPRMLSGDIDWEGRLSSFFAFRGGPCYNDRTSSGTSTYLRTEQEEYYANLIRQQNGSPIPYKRTPSPSLPPDAIITRGPEKPRSAKTIQTTHEPHQCELGIKCTLEIEDLNYHRILATLLVARARQMRLTVSALNPDRDYDDLASLRSFSKYATELILKERWSYEKIRNHA